MFKARLSSRVSLTGIIFGAFFVTCCLAMDADLWQLPLFPEATVIWRDRPIEVNQVKATATHLRTSQPAAKVLQFYKSALEGLGWKYSKDLTPEISTFVKDNKFVYVGIFPAQQDTPRDVYLIASPVSLTICEELRDYFLKEHIMPDTQGKDLDGVPRYPGSRRRLDILMPRQAGVVIYESDSSPRDIARFFRQEMQRAGWKEDKALSTEAVQKFNPIMKDMQILLFNRENNRILFNITLTPKNFPPEAKAYGRTLIIIARNMEKEIASPKKHPELSETPGPDRNRAGVRPVAKEVK
ncbi:MAG: hypothetical protein NT033_07490 [Candidatus Omnitrophica bacterium]|nr:hypothetical protein [Candidatus Omnitrophota bacterium]